MDLRENIQRIQQSLRSGTFINEQSVSQGIVLPILRALGWPDYDTKIVAPEYSLEGKRVDFALCHPAGKPKVFIEVKGVGQSAGADKQLFEYAFHKGIPMAVLTDGQEWNFYLPAEQGDYQERRVYKLDILERELSEVELRLKRYLEYRTICSGEAIESARKDYQDVSRRREIKAWLPKAWQQLVEEQDDMLIEIISDKVENLCGYKPEPAVVVEFLEKTPSAPISMQHTPTGFDNISPKAMRSDSVSAGQVGLGNVAKVHKICDVLFAEMGTIPPRDRVINTAVAQSIPYNTASAQYSAWKNKHSLSTAIIKNGMGNGGCGFVLFGTQYRGRNAIDVMINILEKMSERDPTFLERFAARKHGRRRRYIARIQEELYLDRPDLSRNASHKLKSGWWVGTNYSNQAKEQIIQLACEVSGIKYGEELIVNWD